MLRRKKLVIMSALGVLTPLATWTYESQATVLDGPGHGAGLHDHDEHWLDTVIWTAAHQNGLDPKFVKSIIAVESTFVHNAISKKGAVGYMQVRPETAQEMGYDAADCEQNIYAGSRYLGWLFSRYRNRRNGLELAIAAYNAGPANVARYGGIPPFEQTRAYVTKVMNYYRTLAGQTQYAQAD